MRAHVTVMALPPFVAPLQRYLAAHSYDSHVKEIMAPIDVVYERYLATALHAALDLARAVSCAPPALPAGAARHDGPPDDDQVRWVWCCAESACPPRLSGPLLGSPSERPVAAAFYSRWRLVLTRGSPTAVQYGGALRADQMAFERTEPTFSSDEDREPLLLHALHTSASVAVDHEVRMRPTASRRVRAPVRELPARDPSLRRAHARAFPPPPPPPRPPDCCATNSRVCRTFWRRCGSLRRVGGNLNVTAQPPSPAPSRLDCQCLRLACGASRVPPCTWPPARDGGGHRWSVRLGVVWPVPGGAFTNVLHCNRLVPRRYMLGAVLDRHVRWSGLTQDLARELLAAVEKAAGTAACVSCTLLGRLWLPFRVRGASCKPLVVVSLLAGDAGVLADAAGDASEVSPDRFGLAMNVYEGSVSPPTSLRYAALRARGRTQATGCGANAGLTELAVAVLHRAGPGPCRAPYRSHPVHAPCISWTGRSIWPSWLVTGLWHSGW